jgi:hypothetical protein
MFLNLSLVLSMVKQDDLSRLETKLINGNCREPWTNTPF